MNRQLKAGNALLCENIIRAIDGKVSAIGIFPQIVKLPTRPALILGTVYVNFRAGVCQPCMLEFTVKAPKSSGSGTAEIDAETVHFDIEAPLMGFVEHPDELHFMWRVDDGEWQTAASWEILFEEDARILDDEEIAKLRAVYQARGAASNLLMEARGQMLDAAGELN